MNTLEGMSVLVTGANGFLGSAIIQELRKRKARTVSLIWPPLLNTESSEQDTLAIDLRKTSSYKKINKYGQFDAVIHCAAILPGVASDFDTLMANQEMTYKLLEWTCGNQKKTIIYASTCRVYGLQNHPCTETSPLFPPDVYSVSKLSCEYLIKSLISNFCILRIAAPYGPGSKVNNVIRSFLLNSANNSPITLLGSGNRSQDFVYQTDIANAFCLALQSNAKGIFNLSSGISTSMRELAEMSLRIFNRDIQKNIICSGVDPQEEYRGQYLIDAARKIFGYYPQTQVLDGLRYTSKAWGLL